MANISRTLQLAEFVAPSPVGTLEDSKAGVIVDHDLNIVEFLGNTAPYLQLPPGKAAFNLRTMCRPGLQHAIFSAIRDVKRSQRSSRKQGVQLRVEGRIRIVDVEVNSKEDGRFSEPIYEITFEDGFADVTAATEKAAAVIAAATTIERPRKGPRVIELQRQLHSSRESLAAIVQEHELTLRKLIDNSTALGDTSTELEEANAELEAYSDELETANDALQDALQQRDEAERERGKLEMQIQHTERLKSLGVLAGGVAHDFNNLLAAMIGFADLALADLPRQSSARPLMQEVVKAGERAAELTRLMLAYAGKGSFDIGPLDLSQAVQELHSLFGAAISKKASLGYDLAKDLPAIEADASQIQQVLMNLVSNSSDALGEASGLIEVTTGLVTASRKELCETYVDDGLPEGEYVYLEVRDTGCGMDTEAVGKMFDPFFTTKFTGRGLGLAAVLGIIRGHRGAVNVCSKPDRGTTFRVLFPAFKGPAKRFAVSTSTTVEHGHGTILVVDDEDGVRRVAAQFFEQRGYVAVTAKDGRDAVEVFRRSADSIDAVLLDMTMPNLDGYETFQALRGIRPDVKVLLSSGYAELDVHGRFSGEPRPGFIQKPYRSEKLLESMRLVMERS